MEVFSNLSSSEFWFANSSSISIWVSIRSRDWCSCCPWRSTNKFPVSFTRFKITGVSFRKHLFVPFSEISLLTISSSLNSIWFSERILSILLFPFTSNIPSTIDLAAPLRTTSVEALSPSSRPIASINIDLPAPVSPVIIFNPLPNSTRMFSIRA